MESSVTIDILSKIYAAIVQIAPQFAAATLIPNVLVWVLKTWVSARWRAALAVGLGVVVSAVYGLIAGQCGGADCILKALVVALGLGIPAGWTAVGIHESITKPFEAAPRPR